MSSELIENPGILKLPSNPIVVACPSFDETSGGAIVLHMLVHRLRELGAEAYAFPWTKTYPASMPSWLRLAKTLNRRRKKKPFQTHPSMNVPIAPPEITREAIAVYPEIVTGNPLGAQKVVRWLLHKPGFFGKGDDLSSGDLIFFYQEAFANGLADIDRENLLRVRWIRSDVYFDKGHTRSGSCRMKRKGSLKGTNAVPSPDLAIPLDGLTHVEIAKIFNETEVFYCHDPYTMYFYYAALCGCVPVVLPEENLTRDAWRSSYALKSGVAYGEDELNWAKQTRNELLASVERQQFEETLSVAQFLRKLREGFG